MQNTIKFKIKTMSNLFIGGAPIPFEIGGIDQQTALDQEGFPYIPGSSFKGVLRTIVRENDIDKADDIMQLYDTYLKEERKANQKIIDDLVKEEAALERIKSRYETANKLLSAEYLFGISGFNNTPKLIFSDLLLCEEFRDKKKCFSIDMKNSIDIGGTSPVSTPRSYKTARKGLVFAGEIQMYRIELLGKDAKRLCREYIFNNLKKFNDGVYRLGNSKSRGYGRVSVIIENENEELRV